MSEHNIYKKYYPPNFAPSKIHSPRLLSKIGKFHNATCLQSGNGAKENVDSSKSVVIRIRKEVGQRDTEDMAIKKEKGCFEFHPAKQEFKSETASSPCRQMFCESLSSILERLARSVDIPHEDDKEDKVDINMNIIESEEHEADIDMVEGKNSEVNCETLSAALEWLASGVDIPEKVGKENKVGIDSNAKMSEKLEQAEVKEHQSDTDSYGKIDQDDALDRLAYCLFKLVKPKL